MSVLIKLLIITVSSFNVYHKSYANDINMKIMSCYNFDASLACLSAEKEISWNFISQLEFIIQHGT